MTNLPAADGGTRLGNALAVLLGCVLLSACTGDAYLGSLPIAPDSMPLIADAGTDASPKTTTAAISAAPSSQAVDAASPSADIQLQVRENNAAISELHIKCPERCASLDLAASGGTPPYVYSWDDGASTASRVVCPLSETPMVVTARDTLGATSSIELFVHMEPCKVETLCLANSSFEGAPTFGAAWLGDARLTADSWSDCRSQSTSNRNLPRVVNAASGDEFPRASDGNSYLYLPTHGDQHGLVEQTLCTPLERGSIYYLKLDLAYAAEDSAGAVLEPGQLEIYGEDTACSRSELLWASPLLHTAFRTYCIALQPNAHNSRLVLSPAGPPGKDSAVFVDHLLPVSSCP